VLVEAYVARRDEGSFQELYRAYTPALYRFAVLRVGPDAAEDVVQETWLRAARGLAAFRWQASLRTWLTGIALNLCREHHRRGLRLAAESDPGADGPGTDAGVAVALDLVAGAELRRAIATLADRYREVLLLHDVEGHTHEEIGTLLGISPGTSKSQLHRARRRLRQVFAEGEKRHG
jgi:RNA polymerase sigma-70 factor (ECF subfamily)